MSMLGANPKVVKLIIFHECPTHYCMVHLKLELKFYKKEELAWGDRFKGGSTGFLLLFLLLFFLPRESIFF